MKGERERLVRGKISHGILRLYVSHGILLYVVDERTETNGQLKPVIFCDRPLT